jgi:hypothetical protein
MPAGVTVDDIGGGFIVRGMAWALSDPAARRPSPAQSRLHGCARPRKAAGAAGSRATFRLLVFALMAALMIHAGASGPPPATAGSAEGSAGATPMNAEPNIGEQAQTLLELAPPAVVDLASGDHAGRCWAAHASCRDLATATSHLAGKRRLSTCPQAVPARSGTHTPTATRHVLGQPRSAKRLAALAVQRC